MTQFDFLSAFSGVKSADPDADLERFDSQVAWLGRCADLVYPRKPKGDQKTKEQELRADAHEAHKEYKKARWREIFSISSEAREKTKKEKADRKKTWGAAFEKWAIEEQTRIEKEINSWHPESDFKVSFVASFQTECFVARNDTLMIICFRGTETTSFRDVLADLLGWPTRCIGQDKKPQQHGKVHAGFDDAMRYVWGRLASGTYPVGTLPEILASEDQSERTVWVTGHSLGGALATLAADRMEMLDKLKKDQIGGVVTFGQPRVGEKDFAEGYGLRDRHFRVVNNNDVVTRVPPPVLFEHVGRVVFINRKGVFGNPKSEPRLLERRSQLFFCRLRSRLLAPFCSSLSLMSRLLLLPGLQDHSMTQYNKTLKEWAPIAEHTE